MYLILHGWNIYNWGWVGFLAKTAAMSDAKQNIGENQAQLNTMHMYMELPDKSRAIKGLVVYNGWDASVFVYNYTYLSIIIREIVSFFPNKL